METTEKIVEAYVRYIRGWFTIPNIKCKGQFEIDLLAVEMAAATDVRRYHIESGVSVSTGFAKLTNRRYSDEDLKVRVKQAGQPRTLGYFTKRKFGAGPVRQKLREFGFRRGNYTKVIVSWGWNEDVPVAARRAGVLLWDFRKIVKDIAANARSVRTYFTDDTMRTLQLMAKATQ